MLKLYFSLCFSRFTFDSTSAAVRFNYRLHISSSVLDTCWIILWQRCAHALVMFRHINHLVRVKKTSWFGLKYLIGRHKHGWRCADFSSKISCLSRNTITTGKCPELSVKTSRTSGDISKLINSDNFRSFCRLFQESGAHVFVHGVVVA